ncbi:hypothetical protein CLU79DRAFT_35076 [Phycomyces nitens]|nr:hypothetical protein CLU79DRAFT_35076 [Phycomyces nitens]
MALMENLVLDKLLPLASHSLHSFTPVTFTLTHSTTVTVHSTQPAAISVLPTYSSTQQYVPNGNLPFPLQSWDQARYLWPLLLIFAILGMLFCTSGLVFTLFFCYRRKYQPQSQSRLDTNNGHNNNSHPSPTMHSIFPHTTKSTPGNTTRPLSRILPWLSVRSATSRETLSFQNSARDLMANKEAYTNKTNVLNDSWISRLLHRSGPQTATPSSPSIQFISTFVPMDRSPLTLVPRADILNDPERRRGVDELDLWEQKQKQHSAVWRFAPKDYPESPDAGPSTFSRLREMQTNYEDHPNPGTPGTPGTPGLNSRPMMVNSKQV